MSIFKRKKYIHRQDNANESKTMCGKKIENCTYTTVWWVTTCPKCYGERPDVELRVAEAESRLCIPGAGGLITKKEQ